MARQALAAGLVDELRVDLVPVLLGGGTPFVDCAGDAPIVLNDPRIIEAAVSFT
ncbi:hypothetical protein [Actinomadura nitritigenes]|uniref:hypothetical protein n=1 Tax=Actinomadura nitritigenes TaxID=134602 RepID=UPI003D8F14CB